MAEYAFRCEAADHLTFLNTQMGTAPTEIPCPQPHIFDEDYKDCDCTIMAHRSHKDERVAISQEALISKGGDLRSRSELIIPQRSFFEKRYGKQNADKEIRTWNETHEPEHSGGNRYRPH